MKRFILITGIGAVALLGSHVSMSSGLHPDQLSSFGVLAQGCIVLVLGTSLFASGMLGLAENVRENSFPAFSASGLEAGAWRRPVARGAR